MKAGCLFCRIAGGDVPAVLVAEDDAIFAFLDIMPIREGHVLIVPKAHADYFEDLPPATAAAMLHLGQRLGKAMKRLYGVKRVGFLFSGGDVAHAHAHVVPMADATDLTSRRYIAEENVTFRSLPPVSREQLTATAAALRGAIAAD
jgi:histidine triad (HIT) family protein